MAGFTTLTSTVIPLLEENIDTDQIIPARFLKTIDKAGLGEVLFCDWRYDGEVPTVEAASGATASASFVLNQDRYHGARILFAGDNFGCGSSREHAPWALSGWGLRAIISTSFADIFRNNALKNSLLPVVVDRATHEELARRSGTSQGLSVTIDLPAQELKVPGLAPVSFSIDGFSKRCLIEGVDQLGYLLSHDDRITEYEEGRQ